MEDKELLRVMQQNPEHGISLVMKQYATLCYYIVKQKLSNFSQYLKSSLSLFSFISAIIDATVSSTPVAHISLANISSLLVQE